MGYYAIFLGSFAAGSSTENVKTPYFANYLMKTSAASARFSKLPGIEYQSESIMQLV